ncbi:hypothetical protein DFP73DRAFT_629866 [Morchella snyderi]|nr:hypothetical protein DFP73DRAFT_629866 [Morchella snyderi]
MPQAPTHPTPSRIFFSSPQLAKDAMQKQRKRIPLALLERNGVKINSYPTVDTPPKNAWVKVTPERITLESPPAALGSSIPFPTRTSLGVIKRQAPGKENRPPPGPQGGCTWSRGLKKGSVFGYEIEESDIVIGEELEKDSEEFGFGLVNRGVGKIYCDDDDGMLLTSSDVVLKTADGLFAGNGIDLDLPISVITPRRIGMEYLRKDHSTPLGKREGLARNTPSTIVTHVVPSPAEFEINSCTIYSGVTSPAGYDGVQSDLPEHDTAKNPGISSRSVTHKSTCEELFMARKPTEGDLVLPKHQSRPDANIPIYKLISPAGVCLPLHPIPRPARLPSQFGTSKAQSSLELSRDIVRFNSIPVPPACPIPLIELVCKGTSAPPESRIPGSTLQRKVLPLPRTRAGRKLWSSEARERLGVSTPIGVAHELPPPVVCSGSRGAETRQYCPDHVLDDDMKLGISAKDIKGITAICPANSSGTLRQIPKSQAPPRSPITVSKTCAPDHFDPYLELYSQDSNLPTLYRRMSISNPSRPTPSQIPRRCATMPTQICNAAGRKRSRDKKKKPVPLVPTRRLFDMGPPPPTPEEDRNLNYYGSSYDWWRGMRV